MTKGALNDTSPFSFSKLRNICATIFISPICTMHEPTKPKSTFFRRDNANRTYRVMRIALGNIGIFNIRVGNHRLINGIQIDHHFGKISGIGIRRQRRFVADLISQCAYRQYQSALATYARHYPCPYRSSLECALWRFPASRSRSHHWKCKSRPWLSSPPSNR